MPFKYLDLVKVVRLDPEPGKVVLMNTPEAIAQLAFYTGAVGRVIAKVGGGYKVWFPVPNYPDKGQAVEFTESVLKLHRGAVEADYELAHFPAGTRPMGGRPPNLEKVSPMKHEYPTLPGDCYKPSESDIRSISSNPDPDGKASLSILGEPEKET